MKSILLAISLSGSETFYLFVVSDTKWDSWASTCECNIPSATLCCEASEWTIKSCWANKTPILRPILMQAIFSLIKFNISWDAVLSAKHLTGNHLLPNYFIRLPKEREAKWILHKSPCRMLKLSLLNIIFTRAMKSRMWMGGWRNRLRKLWCSWDNKNNIKISKLMPWRPSTPAPTDEN